MQSAQRQRWPAPRGNCRSKLGLASVSPCKTWMSYLSCGTPWGWHPTQAARRPLGQGVSGTGCFIRSSRLVASASLQPIRSVARQRKEDRDSGLTKKIPMRVPEWISAQKAPKPIFVYSLRCSINTVRAAAERTRSRYGGVADFTGQAITAPPPDRQP